MSPTTNTPLLDRDRFPADMRNHSPEQLKQLALQAQASQVKQMAQVRLVVPRQPVVITQQTVRMPIAQREQRPVSP